MRVSAMRHVILVRMHMQWFNVCWYFLMGVSTALDTLGSQGMTFAANFLNTA